MNDAPNAGGHGNEGVDRSEPDADRVRATPLSAPNLAASLTPEALDEAVVLAGKMSLIGSLVPGLIHDLNNPLSAIRAFSQLLSLDPRLPEDLRGDAELLVEAAERTRQVATGVLEFARSRPPERHPTPLGPLIRSVVELAAYPLSGAQIRVTVDLPPDLPLVPLDRGQMQHALLELTLRAIGTEEAEAQGGTLGVTAAVEGEPVSHVALRLTRDPSVDPMPSSPESGVASWIVAAHGGNLQANATGAATTWTIRLPVAAPSAGERPTSVVPAGRVHADGGLASAGGGGARPDADRRPAS